ncbi:LOW QUALITY PROTEIN: uncharacterized protein si:ch211-63b16.4 [Anguilla rostrata]|uniref:LOW QUALITY PROTEIN: uncharacterized protein si:ch211-63b16.4 n=1 Tax=Anguilla rostrata TaxID=7938 RepID=UPI0030CC4F8B
MNIVPLLLTAEVQREMSRKRVAGKRREPSARAFGLSYDCAPKSRGTPKQVAHETRSSIKVEEPNRIVVDTGRGHQPHSLDFDAVWGENATQKDVYESTAKPLVEALLQGYNGCVITYGSPGSGKSYTLLGGSLAGKQRGIISRAAEDIFNTMESLDCKIRVSFIHVANEKIYDLLESPPAEVSRIHEGEEMVFVEGLKEVEVGSAQDLLQLYRRGAANRHSGGSKGESASKGHTIFNIIAISANLPEGSDVMEGQGTVSKLTLVDLASSGKALPCSSALVEGKRSFHTTQENRQEAKILKRSLTIFGNVIFALSSSACQHVPYRESKLTRILRDCLGGNCQTCLIVTVSSNLMSVTETLSSLQFACRAVAIPSRAVRASQLRCSPVQVRHCHAQSSPVQVRHCHAQSSPVQVRHCHAQSSPVQVSHCHAQSSPVQIRHCHTQSSPVQVSHCHAQSSPVQVRHCHARSSPVQMQSVKEKARASPGRHSVQLPCAPDTRGVQPQTSLPPIQPGPAQSSAPWQRPAEEGDQRAFLPQLDRPGPGEGGARSVRPGRGARPSEERGGVWSRSSSLAGPQAPPSPRVSADRLPHPLVPAAPAPAPAAPVALECPNCKRERKIREEYDKYIIQARRERDSLSQRVGQLEAELLQRGGEGREAGCPAVPSAARTRAAAQAAPGPQGEGSDSAVCGRRAAERQRRMTKSTGSQTELAPPEEEKDRLKEQIVSVTQMNVGFFTFIRLGTWAPSQHAIVVLRGFGLKSSKNLSGQKECQLFLYNFLFYMFLIFSKFGTQRRNCRLMATISSMASVQESAGEHASLVQTQTIRQEISVGGQLCIALRDCHGQDSIQGCGAHHCNNDCYCPVMLPRRWPSVIWQFNEETLRRQVTSSAGSSSWALKLAGALRQAVVSPRPAGELAEGGGGSPGAAGGALGEGAGPGEGRGGPGGRGAEHPAGPRREKDRQQLRLLQEQKEDLMSELQDSKAEHDRFKEDVVLTVTGLQKQKKELLSEIEETKIFCDKIRAENASLREQVEALLAELRSRPRPDAHAHPSAPHVHTVTTNTEMLVVSHHVSQQCATGAGTGRSPSLSEQQLLSSVPNSIAFNYQMNIMCLHLFLVFFFLLEGGCFFTGCTGFPSSSFPGKQPEYSTMKDIDDSLPKMKDIFKQLKREHGLLLDVMLVLYRRGWFAEDAVPYVRRTLRKCGMRLKDMD